MLNPAKHDDVRANFPGTGHGPYFDVSGRGLMCVDSRRELDTYLDQRVAGTADKKAMFAKVEEARHLFAALVKSSPDEIAFTRNVTDGIAAFASSLAWNPGENVVICEAIEHPANVYPWYGLEKRYGIQIKNIQQESGHIPVDRILNSIDSATRVVAVSPISFAPGFRLPIAKLGAECRKRGVLLLADAAQSIGVMDTDVNEWQVDALVASTQKGLMALYGMGLLYIKASLAETLEPMHLSRFGVDLPAGHEASTGDLENYRLAPGARRFDVGNFNYAAAFAVVPSLKFLLGLGTKEVEAHVFGLARRFADEMLRLGLPVYGGAPGEHSSHIVTVGHALGFDHDSSADREMSELYDYLVSHGVRLGIRRDLLRFSFHIYNNGADVDAVIQLCRDWLAQRTYRSSEAAV